MARLTNGLNGPVIGKLGNHVHYIRKGEDIVRMRPHPSHKPRSEEQKAQNNAFAVVMRFVSPLKKFINAGFKVSVIGTTKTAQNEAVSVNLKLAVKGVYPDLEMDYTKAMVTKGSLPSALNPVLSYTLDGNKIQLKFQWDKQSDLLYPRSRDQVMMVAYLPANKKTFYSVSGNRRQAGEDILHGSIRLSDKGNTLKDRYIETYISFVSDDREQIADSIYVGRIDLEA
jgi:hypothetical protein